MDEYSVASVILRDVMSLAATLRELWPFYFCTGFWLVDLILSALYCFF